VIRFSAGLVVVAIGVLIVGGVTSKLSLVYVAIVVSAVALVVLVIGVALKRDEIFGDEPELAPADAGAGSGTSAGQSAGTGHVRGSDGDAREDQPQILPSVPGPATAAFAAAAAASASAAAPTVAAPTVAAPTVAVPSVTAPPVTAPPVGSPMGSRALGNPPVGNPPLGQRRPAFSQASTREADSAADWQTRSPQPQWSSGDQASPTWTPKEPTSRQPAASSAPSVKAPQSGAAGTTSASPRAWGSPEQPPTVPAAVARAGSVAASPSWFDKLNQPVADSAARMDTEQSEPSVAAQTVAAQTVAAPTVGVVSDPDTADDDDWPTRYSWLEDDESDEAGTSGKPAAVDEVAQADDVAQVDDVPEVDEASPDEAKSADPAAAELGSLDAPEPMADADHDADADADVDVDADASEDPAVAEPTDSAADSGAEPAENLAAADHEDQPLAERQSDAKLVTVIPGVPRYHDPDCILIRFMDDDDIARKSIPEAKAANCTPCVACQPEG
jgi:hypothetical protein